MELSRQTPTAGTLDVADTAAMLEEDGDEDELAGSYDNLSEEEQMRLALQLSMQTAKEEATTTAAPAPTSAPAPEPATPAAPAATAATATTAVDTTPAATASVATPAAPARKDDKPDYSAELNNPEYLNSLFQDLPGVDFSSSSIQVPRCSLLRCSLSSLARTDSSSYAYEEHPLGDRYRWYRYRWYADGRQAQRRAKWRHEEG